MAFKTQFFRKNTFDVQRNIDFVQCLNIRDNHWITVSAASSIPDTINVYDSLNGTLTETLKQIIADFMHSAGKEITVQYVNVQYQKGSQDCAFACEVCFGKDPSSVKFVQSTMRQHLIEGLEQGNILPFHQLYDDKDHRWHIKRCLIYSALAGCLMMVEK